MFWVKSDLFCYDISCAPIDFNLNFGLVVMGFDGRFLNNIPLHFGQ